MKSLPGVSKESDAADQGCKDGHADGPGRQAAPGLEILTCILLSPGKTQTDGNRHQEGDNDDQVINDMKVYSLFHSFRDIRRPLPF